MSGNMYTVSFEDVAVTAAQDLFELVAAAGKPLIIHAIFLSQSSDIGTSEMESLRVRIRRGATVSGSGGSAPTPAALNPSSAAASFTAEANNTTQAGTGTIVLLHSDSWEIHGGFQLVFTPEMRPQVAGGGRIVVDLEGTPTDSLTMHGTIYVEEVG